MSFDLDHYMSLPYSYKITPDPELGYFIEIPDLPGCRGDGKTIDDAISDITETKRLWFEEALEQGYKIPLPHEEREYGGQFLLRMPKSLHQAIAEEAKWEGISMTLYLNTLITECRHIRATTLTYKIVDDIRDKITSTYSIVETFTMNLTETFEEMLKITRDSVKVEAPQLIRAA